MRIRTPQTRTTRLGATALAGVVGASLLGLGSAPALAVPGPVVAHEAAECTVTDTVLTWGVKESFRSYIDTIAKGTATPDGEGVTYETPNYIWAPGSGTVSNHGDAASIAQTGTVHFEGHEGVLQLFVANPSLEIVSAEEAYLRLDLKSTTPTGEEAIDEQQVRAVELDIAGRLSADGVALTFDAAPGKLTPEGAKAFGGFYAAYDEMDPVTLTGKTSCEFEAGALPEPESTETPQAQ
ncbi:HtaA domain-containing protein, partial [Leucobacter sp. M11]|uniref:HtaA domain-containing protein n=1 Tax=Leucobacter sp. M11 TaxID=2993565 RepID=UPI002D80347B